MLCHYFMTLILCSGYGSWREGGGKNITSDHQEVGGAGGGVELSSMTAPPDYAGRPGAGVAESDVS